MRPSRWRRRAPTRERTVDAERLQILKMLEAGQVDAEGAAALLAAVEDTGAGQEDADRQTPPASTTPSSRPGVAEGRWARFWIYPLLAGGAVLILGALVLVLVYATGAARGWSVCGWLPLSLGLLVMLLGWWTRRAKWLHVRIREGGRNKVTLSFPLPLTFAAWVLRLIQPFVPQLRETGVDELIIALRESGRDEPIAIDVQDGEDGERVQVYIG
jgi:hypothetical protein